MYNEHFKQGFIKKIRNNDPLSKQFFAVSGPLENQYGKDVSQFDEEELDRFLRGDLIAGKMSLYSIVQLLTQYARYCRHKKMPATDAYKSIKTDLVDEMRETMCASPLHLAKKLDRSFSAIEENNVDLLCRCFLWFAYAEMDLEDITAVRREDIDLMNRVIHFGGQDYRIYEEAYQAVRRVCELGSFRAQVYINEYTYFERTHPEMFFSGKERGEYNPKSKQVDLRARISSATSAAWVPLSYSAVRMSGLFYRVYDLERAGAVKDPEDVLVPFDTRGGKAGSKASENNIKRTKQGIIEKYKAWKKAFTV